mmetsp:Transcript_24815/g.36599  ORF Transcript_24815/g.36599 Transcript_24815/m.36599 type:complete len:191 (-) Transcript_24815:39-611(-)
MDVSRYYHEKQRLGHCAIHALNNIFQERWITYEDLSAIARELHDLDRSTRNMSYCAFNPYISFIPYAGYFDISCILKAIERRKCRFSNHIISISDLGMLDMSASQSAMGLIVNEYSSCVGLFTSRHWYAVLYLRDYGVYVNLDSRLDRPIIIDSHENLVSMLRSSMSSQRTHVFVLSKCTTNCSCEMIRT